MLQSGVAIVFLLGPCTLGKSLDTLVKFLVCAESEVSVWCRYQHVKASNLIPIPFKHGNETIGLSIDLKFQELGMCLYKSCSKVTP